ncbi:hypothetical protein LF1_47970 [Rubripirellula obstinata]|uniref:Uncharacterized protein n=1 Tax=Rubripirellula obstinata TaxID=406547 RepID=A0A5B1CQJ1_9BACT|nr:hypothetical protein LF1_47970 [Rubripirellula obstinata]
MGRKHGAVGLDSRREVFWPRKKRVSSFNRVGIAPRVSPRMDARGDAHAVKQSRNPSRRWVLPHRIERTKTEAPDGAKVFRFRLYYPSGASHGFGLIYRWPMATGRVLTPHPGLRTVGIAILLRFALARPLATFLRPWSRSRLLPLPHHYAR